jgi:hypothetical protein
MTMETRTSIKVDRTSIDGNRRTSIDGNRRTSTAVPKCRNYDAG